MIKIENPNGCIEITETYFAKLIGDAASSCFGVAQMANSSAIQGIKGFFSKGTMSDKGVSVCVVENALVVDLHIIVGYGLNISAIAKSIINKVKYTVEEATGLRVRKVNVYVDGMTAE
ncbi:MAG: Asp23/Gls24 family envelope stress response protein [Clostridia bacterium]|nr:Asp23/Gls24 family envelope stress response protein [Clostridia bacterium]